MSPGAALASFSGLQQKGDADKNADNLFPLPDADVVQQNQLKLLKKIK